MEQIGRYNIISELGRGGMATVFHAYDPRFERDVAIKVLPRALQHDPQFRTRFEREAKTIALLEHPSIVPVYDFGQEDEEPYIVMRLMTGGSLSEKLENGPLDVEEALKIVHRLGGALDIAHIKGVIHRDLKPGNILFDQYGHAFLADFGIARITMADEGMTGSAIIGTPAFMSPEQIQGEKTIDGRSDIYGLGIILFYMLTKDMPFQADTPAKVMMMHILDPAPDIRQSREDLPSGVSAVLIKALAKDPDERYANGQELAEAFEKAIRGIPSDQELDTNASVAKSSIESAPTSVPAPLAPPTIENQSTVVGPPPAAQPAPAAVAAPAKRKFSLPLVAGLVVIFGGGIIVLGMILYGIFGLGGLPTTAATDTQAPDQPPPASETAAIPSDTAAPQATEAILVDPTDAPTEVPEDTPVPEPTATLEPQAPIIGGADKLAYVRDGNIWMVNLDGTDLVQLTSDGGLKEQLEWSPDGQSVMFMTGSCLQFVTVGGQTGIVACFRGVSRFDGYGMHPDNSQIGFSIDRELYVVPFDAELLNPGRDISRTDLAAMADCEHFAPYSRNLVTDIMWSRDGSRVALKVIVPLNGLQGDTVQILNFSACVEKPPILDNFPPPRFDIAKYDTIPTLPHVSWDGDFLFAMNSLVRNEGFGDMYIYNAEDFRGNMLNPIDGKCCYRDATWSPDGRMLMFAFQDFGGGQNSVTVLYYVPFGTMSSGQQLIPLPVPELTNAREFPQPALRPAQLP